MKDFNAAKPCYGRIFITEDEVRRSPYGHRSVMVKLINDALDKEGIPAELHKRVFLSVTRVNPMDGLKYYIKVAWRYVPDPGVYNQEDQRESSTLRGGRDDTSSPDSGR